MAVGARDSLDSHHGTVRVHRKVHARHTVFVHILRGDLAVGGKLREQVGARHEPAFAMRDRHGVHVAHLGLGEPGGEVRRDARAHKAALVAADLVERERGALVGHRHDVAVRHKTQLDEGLEAVADAEHEAIAVLEQIAHGLSDRGRAEERGDELRRTIRLVAARETAGDHDDLAAANLVDERLRRFGDGLRGEVVDDERRDLRASALKRGSGIVFAVVSREHRDHHARLGDLRPGVRCAPAGVEDHGLHEFVGLVFGVAVGEHVFKRAFPCLLQRREGEILASGMEGVVLGRFADFADLHEVRRGGDLRVIGEFDDERTVCRGEQVVDADRVVQTHTDVVAERHAEQRFGGAAIARGGDSHRVMEVHELFDRGEGLEQAVLVRCQAIGMVHGGDADHTVARRLELGGSGAAHVTDRHGERDQRGRHIQVLERAGHGILAADRARAQVDLGHERAQHGGDRLAPTVGFVAQLLEVFLEAQVRLFMLEAGGHELGERFHDRKVCAGELVALHDVGVEAPCHG